MKLYKVSEIASILRVTERTIYNWIEYGHLRAIKVGEGKGTIRIPEDSLAEFLNNCQTVSSSIPFKKAKKL